MGVEINVILTLKYGIFKNHKNDFSWLSLKEFHPHVLPSGTQP